MKIDAKNTLISFVLIIVLIAFPYIENHRKTEIIKIFGNILNILTPISDCGLMGILFFSSIVSLWDGISVVPVRYVEFLVALSYNTIPEFVLIMIIGKTMGGFLTYKIVNEFMNLEDLDGLIRSTNSSFYVLAVIDLLTEKPLFYGTLIRMFFPSILNCLALALLPLNQS